MPNIVSIVEKHFEKSVLCISGPTAVGKTSVAIKVAQSLQTEIVSFDSRQFYREIPIGTAAPDENERATVPHHFILDRSIHDPLNAADFANAALQRITELHKKHSTVILVGGSGLYLKALLEGFDDIPDIDPGIRSQLNLDFSQKGLPFLQEELRQVDPEYASTVDLQNPQRIIRALEVFRGSGKKYSSFRQARKRDLGFTVKHVGLTMNREKLYDRINRRVGIMVDLGLIEEAEALKEFENINALQTVGYKELFRYFKGEYDLQSALEEIRKNSRRYAKRQLTWFRRDPAIQWLEPEQWESILEKV